MANNRSAAPFFAALILLLVPVLYVASYYWLVVPEGQTALKFTLVGNSTLIESRITHYRAGSDWNAICFWPIERLDRRLRPSAWEFYLPEDGDLSSYTQRAPLILDDLSPQ